MTDPAMTDVTGTPRSLDDIRSALACIESEVVRNPTAMSKSGEPLLMHYLVVRDALRELVRIREVLATVTAAVSGERPVKL